jgi:hypothetical protein
VVPFFNELIFCGRRPGGPCSDATPPRVEYKIFKQAKPFDRPARTRRGRHEPITLNHCIISFDFDFCSNLAPAKVLLRSDEILL